MSSLNPDSKIFSGESFPEVFHPNILVGHLILHQFRIAPERIVQINGDDGVKVNGEEMAVLMKKAAAFLKNHGLEFGDVVGFCAANTTYLAPAVYACLLLGLPIAAVPNFYDVNQLVASFQRTKPKLIFCDHEQAKTVEEASKVLKSEIKIVVLTDHVEGFMNFKEIIETFKVLDPVPHNLNVSSDKVCAVILASSGSTGEPKFARVSHAQLRQSEFQVYAFKSDSILLSFTALFWASAMCTLVHGVLNQQTRLFTKESFTSNRCVELISKHKVSFIFLIPAALNEIVRLLQSNVNLKDLLDSVQVLNLSGCPTSLKSIEAMEKFLPNGRVQFMYGMTEACGVIARSDLNEPTSLSVGKLCTNVQAKVLTEEGTFGGIGDVGEILLKIPFNIIDYLGDEKRTRELIDDDAWMHTGDLGYFDEKLNLFLVGRQKFMIRYRNYQVNPIEIEDLISGVEGVLEVCVVAAFSLADFEIPAAVIQKSPTSELTEADIHEAVKHLEDFKQLRGGVIFVDSLPVTPNGKLNRNAIAELFISELLVKK